MTPSEATHLEATADDAILHHGACPACTCRGVLTWHAPAACPEMASAIWPKAPSAVALQRFVAKVDIVGPGECWPWTGSRRPAGYGNVAGGLVASRVSLQWSAGPPPSENHDACHTCDNPPCVNPNHLWWGSRADNMKDAQAKGRAAVAAHGKSSLYRSGCRCAECVAGNRERVRARVARQVERGPRAHGLYYVYKNFGCRCDECRAANAERVRSRYQAERLRDLALVAKRSVTR